MFKERGQLSLIVATVLLGGTLALFLFLFFPEPSSGKTVVVQTYSDLATSTTSQPIRLEIPRIKIKVKIEPVGLTLDGAMAVPKGPIGVAWFKFGPRPGEVGSAVISGHYGWKDNIPASFDHLSRLRKGDRVYVYDDRGGITIFVVRFTRSYSDDAEVPGVFDSNDNRAHLNLVTCGGVYNHTKKSYSKRLVVFTDRE